eukprot:GILK01009426.1.p1 GENE.GILK01009426.1~~GILK01009426.1.p1  ORF type:complete len:542 (-),score=82.14 GILK01009426.1:98-1723(-)
MHSAAVMSGSTEPRAYAYRTAFLLGIADGNADLDGTYAMYFIVSDLVGCDFESMYGLFFLVNSIVLLFWQPVAGWLVDKFDARRVLFLSALLGTGCLGIVYARVLPVYVNLLVFNVRQCCINQTLYAVWKIIKIEAEEACGKDIMAQEVYISRLGTVGDLITEAHEVVTLGVAYGISRHWSSYTAVTGFLYANIIAANVIVLVLSYYTLSDPMLADVPSFSAEGTMESQPLTQQAVRSDSIQSDSDIEITPLHNGSPRSCESDLLVSDHRQLSDAFPVEASCPSKTMAHVNRFGRQFMSVFVAFGVFWRQRYLYLQQNLVAKNAIYHSFLLYVVSTLLSYPVNMEVAAQGTHTDTDGTDTASLDNFCNGYLSKLLQQGFFSMVLYVVGSLVYMFGLVKCPPRIYYRYVYPVSAAVLTAVLLPLYSFPLSSIASSSLLSVATVVPYYLNAYDYYLATSAIRPSHYGFFAALYGNVNSLIMLVPGLLMSHPALASKELLVGVCMLFLAASTAQALWFEKTYRTDLSQHRSHPDNEVATGTPAL